MLLPCKISRLCNVITDFRSGQYNCFPNNVDCTGGGSPKQTEVSMTANLVVRKGLFLLAAARAASCTVRFG